MISMTLNQLAKILHGEIFGHDAKFNTIVTDTRKVIPGCLFVALKGKYFDGHDFVIQAKVSGAEALLVNHRLHINLPQLIVENTQLALGEIAAWIRQKMPTRIVALTGSSGKTSVKEMTASILSQCGNTLYTIGNLNNDFGVPMTLLRLTQKHKYAVIELSASYYGAIAWTVSLTRPEAALVNNLAAAHLNSFDSLAGVAKAKGEIYAGLSKNGIAILNADNNDWLNWKTIIGTRKTWSFSLLSSSSDFIASNIHIMPYSSKFTLQTPIGNISIFLPLPGLHNIANVLAAAALATAVGAPLTAIKAGIANLKAIPGRLFPIPLTKTQLLLDDSYNANVSSMTAAIQVLSKMPGYRVMVVGDMDELGYESESYHIKVGKIAKVSGIDQVLSIGKISKKLSQISNFGKHFANKATLIIYLKTLLNRYPVITILVKGSRSAAMEEVVYALQENKTC